MERKRRLSRALSVLLAVLLLCASASAAVQGERTIRLACGFNDFLQVDAGGAVTGCYADYLEALARLYNWRYEYVYATWPEAEELLKEGEVDFLFPVNYTFSRDQAMDFTDMPIGFTAAGVFALETSGYAYDGFDAFDGARIAVSRHSTNEDDLNTLSRQHGFSYEPVYLDTDAAMMQALRDGQADLAVFSAASQFPEGMLVSIMSSRPVYFAVRDGNHEMLAMLNDGMQTLLKNQPDLVAEVLRTTMTGSNAGMVALTEEERAFVASGVPVKVGFYEETEPLGYQKDDGTYSGIYVRILEYLAEESGIRLEAVPINRDRNWKDLVNSHEIDFYIGASDVIVSRNDELRTTDPVLHYANVLVTRNDYPFNQLEAPVIALTSGRAYWADYLQDYLSGELQIKFYRTGKDCMLAVVKGEVDATLLNNLEFNYHSKNGRLSSLIQWSKYRFPTSVGLAAASDVDETMFSAVSKAIGLLPSEYVNAVTDECLSIPYHSYSAADTLYNARLLLSVIAVVLLAAAGILALILTFRRRQKQVQMELLERERQHLQLLAATSNDFLALYYVDLDTNVSVAMMYQHVLDGEPGAGAEPVKKYSDAIRKFAEEIVQPEYRERVTACADRKAVLRRFAEEGAQFSLRFPIRANPRGQTNYEMQFIPVEKNLQGHAMMVLGVRCIDTIIAEEQAQRQLLQDALDSANQANAAKSEFFSRMSHDIRTPLNAIIGMTAIAAVHAEEPDRVRDALNKLTGASRHLLSLINDVLDMSKIETGKMSLAEEDINLPELVEALLSIIQPRIREHNHRLQVNLQGIEHEAVIGDSLRIRQVFLNLMGNAVKYTPNGGEISLKIREIPIEMPGVGCYEFTIADNGLGMSQAYLEHIFEPFSRAEDQQINQIQGTGLGMAITQSIVQMMNGTIRVESEPGKGSTFTVTIFLKLRDAGDAAATELAGLSVLVADEEPEARASLCAIMSDIGMQPVECASGKEAVERILDAPAGTSPYHAVILGWHMDGMEGAEAAEAIKLHTGVQPPFVILSAYDASDVEAEARAAGVDAFLAKPAFRSGVVRVFQQLEGNAAREPAEAAALGGLTEADFSGRRVLLVEDNELNREIAMEILEMAGLSLEEAENGQVALDRFSGSEPGYYDLILMDVQMPVMDGLAASRAIRALDRPDAKAIPIVAMTANAFVEDIQTCHAAGMNDHLAKPIDFEKLNILLAKYLS